MSNRIDKLNDLIRDNISIIINKNLSLKQGVFVSLIRVDTSKDLTYANVFISVFPENEIPYAFNTIKKEKKRIQRLLNQKLTIKIFPKIKFQIDNGRNKLTDLDKLFDIIKNEK